MNASADIRAFYAALGIELPDWAQRNATIRCFADPDAHAHEDRNPSCSVSLEHGAWRCWACGATGGAYDAAVAVGRTPASAFDLLVVHGLAQRSAALAPSSSDRKPHPLPLLPRTIRTSRARPPLAATEDDVKAWHQALLSEHGRQWRERLQRQRLWSIAAIRKLELGFDRERITIPIRDADGGLRGVLRYQPSAPGPKMLAVPGTRLGLIPHPATERSQRILLVEGPPDMIASRSHGWPAIAVPGDHTWEADWATLLEGRSVTVLTDSDAAGRDAAQRIATDLQARATVRIVDLAPNRDDGYDLTDWLLEQPHRRRTRCAASSSPKPTITP